MRVTREPSPYGLMASPFLLIIGSYLPSKHDIKIVCRLPLAVNVLPSDVTMVGHAVGERPDL